MRASIIIAAAALALMISGCDTTTTVPPPPLPPALDGVWAATDTIHFREGIFSDGNLVDGRLSVQPPRKDVYGVEWQDVSFDARGTLSGKEVTASVWRFTYQYPNVSFLLDRSAGSRVDTERKSFHLTFHGEMVGEDTIRGALTTPGIYLIGGTHPLVPVRQRQP